jgi:dienelactone hydrolase
VLVAAAVVMLFVQAGLHQSWSARSQNGLVQLLMLCGFCNGLGILMLYAFVKLKVRGLI